MFLDDTARLIIVAHREITLGDIYISGAHMILILLLVMWFPQFALRLPKKILGAP